VTDPPVPSGGLTAGQGNVTDKDGTASATANSTANIASSGLTISPVSVTAIETQTFSGTMATFTDAGSTDTAAQYSATINWGDGTSSTGAVSGTAGTFTVAATHAYADEGSFPINVQVVDTKSVPAFTANANASATSPISTC